MLESVIKKIPGQPPPIPSKDKDSYIEDVTKVPKPKLLELIDRQKKIISNRNFLSKLPDKGERLMKNYEKLLNEVKSREAVEANLCSMMSSLTVEMKEIGDFEWTGDCNPGSLKKKSMTEVTEDDDSEEANPFKILATHSGAGFAKKEIRVEKAPKSLIRRSDLTEENSGGPERGAEEKSKEKSVTLANVEEYAVHLCEKFDAGTVSKSTEKFYPHRTIKERSSKSPKESLNKKNKPPWEVTAATPPPPIHENVKIVSLKESLVIQQEQARQLKEVQEKHAEERLSEMRGLHQKKSSIAAHFSEYRDPKESDADESSDGEEKEIHDEEEQHDTDVAVFYNVSS